jgi:hypothetical protein
MLLGASELICWTHFGEGQVDLVFGSALDLVLGSLIQFDVSSFLDIKFEASYISRSIYGVCIQFKTVSL